MRRSSLPLLLAALLAASGCVTVHRAPTPAAHVHSPAAALADPEPADESRPGRLGAAAALPLSPLPETTPGTPAEPAEPDLPPGSAARPVTSVRETGAGRDPGSAPRRTVIPERAPRPGLTAKRRPSTRTPAPHRPARPATGAGARAGEMARLCQAARGVTSPAVAALCQQTWR
ncbi:hypothetical protein ACIA6C_13885 [Streptomyces sp. NPDC051578]|uniref:hypothetical protein n=1 Tax=Streptomyces sp. NPDC051578 TaxID=3365662 RepID=UPI0037956DB2